ncbi:MAG: CsgG/HfaB family protein [Thermodesulfobacteriota bacterium]
MYKIFFLACHFFILAGLLMLTSCATTYTEKGRKAAEKYPQQLTRQPDFPEYTGPKTVAAVLPLGLSARAAENYPHLLRQDVGFGIHNRVIDTLYETGRFRFVEEKKKVVKDVMDRQWMSSAGMVDQATAVKMGKMLGARKVIYGEIYDYAQGGEQIRGFSARSNTTTRVGVQIRLVDVETLEYVPASGIGYGPDVGLAAGQAIHSAVSSLLDRL